jgi:hypothetical protein
MPILPNHKHELFAQGLAKGLSADAAYQAAGYKRDRGNAARLTANDSIQKRVAEIQGKAAEKAMVAPIVHRRGPTPRPLRFTIAGHRSLPSQRADFTLAAVTLPVFPPKCPMT